MSFAERHSMLFVAFIHVASFGADQFSFGSTEPPSSAIAVWIREWISGQRVEGSRAIFSASSWELEEEEEGEEKNPLS